MATGLTAAVEAAARVLDGPAFDPDAWVSLSFGQTPEEARSERQHMAREMAWSALTAAAPVLEAHVRESVAAEIEVGIPLAEKRREDWITRQEPDQVMKYRVVIETLKHTARIARGAGTPGSTITEPTEGTRP